MSLFSQNRSSSVSAIGEKFVFSNFLEPVSEEATEKELNDIDAWLESSCKEENESCKEGSSCKEEGASSAKDEDTVKESTEVVEESTTEEETTKTTEVSESVEEDNEGIDMNRLSECVTLYEATGNEAYLEEMSAIIAEKAESSHKRIEKMYDKKYDKDHGFEPGATAKKKGYDKSVKTYDGKPVPAKWRDDVAGKSAKFAREKDDLSKKQIESRKADLKKAHEDRVKYLAKEAATEAICNWYNENDIEITDYEAGRIDMFVEQFVSESIERRAERLGDKIERAQGNPKKLARLYKKGDKLIDKGGKKLGKSPEEIAQAKRDMRDPEGAERREREAAMQKIKNDPNSSYNRIKKSEEEHQNKMKQAAARQADFEAREKKSKAEIEALMSKLEKNK